MMRRHHLTCAQFVDKAEAFALETLDELEQGACARHIVRTVHHHGCREALATAQSVVDRLTLLVPGGPPPAALWSAIEARLSVGTGSSNAEWL